MSGIKTLADLRTQIKRRADMENTGFVSDAEVDEYAQQSWGELYDLILEAAGPQVFTRLAATITTASGTASYQINEVGSTAAQVYKVMKVILNDSGSPRELSPNGRIDVLAEAQISGVRGKPERYIVTGPATLRASASQTDRFLALDPVPDAAYSVYVLYVPVPPDLTTSSTQNLYSFAGWEEYVIVDAAAKCLEKEESDSTHLIARKLAMADRIRFNARTLHGDGGGRIRDLDEFTTVNWWEGIWF